MSSVTHDAATELRRIQVRPSPHTAMRRTNRVTPGAESNAPTLKLTSGCPRLLVQELDSTVMHGGMRWYLLHRGWLREWLVSEQGNLTLLLPVGLTGTDSTPSSVAFILSPSPLPSSPALS
jgi:hypothetical protein